MLSEDISLSWRSSGENSSRAHIRRSYFSWATGMFWTDGCCSACAGTPGWSGWKLITTRFWLSTFSSHFLLEPYAMFIFVNYFYPRLRFTSVLIFLYIFSLLYYLWWLSHITTTPDALFQNTTEYQKIKYTPAAGRRCRLLLLSPLTLPHNPVFTSFNILSMLWVWPTGVFKQFQVDGRSMTSTIWLLCVMANGAGLRSRGAEHGHDFKPRENSSSGPAQTCTPFGNWGILIIMS